MDIVLYTDASPPRPVNTRLDRHHCARHQRRFRGACEAWGLMHLQSEPMPETVPESLPVPVPLNVAPSERVGSHSRHPRPHRVRGDVICVPYHRVDFALFRGRDTDDEGACHIRAVSMILRAEIDEEEVAALDLACGSSRVRKCRARARRDDRRKGCLLAPFVPQRFFEETSNRELAPA